MTSIYAFGSITRGEFDQFSDVDLLAIVDKFDPRFSKEKFSVYSTTRLLEMWAEGNPFAWHLHLEAKLLYTSADIDTLKMLGIPEAYKNGLADCRKFQELFETSLINLKSSSSSTCFELSNIFLAMRNFATCFSLQMTESPIFSRNSAILIQNKSAPISNEAFEVCRRARILSTRGLGQPISYNEKKCVIKDATEITNWMNDLLGQMK